MNVNVFMSHFRLKQLFCIAKSLLRVILLLPYSVRALFKSNAIYLNVYSHVNLLVNRHYNWGDDLNYLFLRKVIKQETLFYDWNIFSCFLQVDNYLCIGSIIESRSNARSIIWGSGCISKDKPFVKPKKVLAVRGPLTRKRLLDAGVECPEIYGDPALLLPLYYKSACKKKYKIGVIPHYVDKNCKIIDELRYAGIKIIDVQNYANFTDVIDEVNECELVLSSSLHGLILLDAYGVPNIWVEFSQNIIGDRFKFYDYLLSVGREATVPVYLDKMLNLDELIKIRLTYIKPNIDIGSLLKSCPFDLKENMKF